VSPVKYELGFYISQDDYLHSHSRETFKSYVLGEILCEEGRRSKRWWELVKWGMHAYAIGRDSKSIALTVLLIQFPSNMSSAIIYGHDNVHSAAQRESCRLGRSKPSREL
jgi:hypothetical protein